MPPFPRSPLIPLPLILLRSSSPSVALRCLSTSAPALQPLRKRGTWDYIVPEPKAHRSGRDPSAQLRSTQHIDIGLIEPVLDTEPVLDSGEGMMDMDEWLGGAIEQVPEDRLPTPEPERSKPAAPKSWKGALDGFHSMIVFENGNKSTLPGEFYRVSRTSPSLSSSGKSWSMMRVIQARRPTTLEPLPTYYLLFPSAEAAKTYKQELRELADSVRHDWDLQKRLTIVPPDVLTMSFSLITGKLYMYEHFAQMNQEATLRQVQETQNLVAVDVEGRQLQTKQLGELLDQDGRERNQYWKLVPSWGLGGISLTGDGHFPEDPESPGSMDINKFASQFFLAFEDRHEARRFIRHWHRRQDRHHIINAYLLS